MAGTHPSFDPAVFREAIKSTMLMGLPLLNNERATFRWNPEKTYAVEDRNDKPYDWSSTPVTNVTHADVQIDVAVEFKPVAGANETLIGQINTDRAVLTLLDVDFPDVEGANEVLLGGNTYSIQYWGPPLGLFSVTIYQVYLSAVDES